MLVRILKSQTEKHVDRDLGTILCESGLAEEVVRDGGARPQPAAQCELRWSLGHRTDDDKVSVLKYSCDACGINGGGLGQLGAKQLAERPPVHRGKVSPPPKELVGKAYGHNASLLGTASMASMQAGYKGSTTPWTWTLADQLAAEQGRTPADKLATGLPSVYLGDVNDV